MKRDWFGIALLFVVLLGAAVATAQIPNTGGLGGGGGGGPAGPVGPLNLLVGPMTGNYSGGGFFTILDMGTYPQLGSPITYGGNNEAVNGQTSPRVVSYTSCAVESDGSSTVATIGANFVTLNAPLSAVPDAGTALNDTTLGVVFQIQANAGNTTSKLFLNSVTAIAASDAVSTGTAMYCVTPATAAANHLLVVSGGLDQTEASFTPPTNAQAAPFSPSTIGGKISMGWGIPITTAPLSAFTFSWPTAANGSFNMYDIENPNLAAPFENTSGFSGTSSNVTSINIGGVVNTQTNDLFLTTILQRTGVVQSLSGTPTQGKGIIEDVLYNASNSPGTACANTGQNAYGYANSTYNNVLFTDPQWGGTYQRMIRPAPGGNVDHNMYYTRPSWNSNHTLMLGITSPPSSSGTGSPWILNLFDQNGCFLKPLFYLTGATNNIPEFNWRVAWSKLNPNIFYTTGQSGSIILNGQTTSSKIQSNDIYSIHPCATSLTGSPDAECGATTVYTVDDIFHFNALLPTGSNFISTNQPTGPSLDESGARIGLITRATGSGSGDYYWSSLPFTTEPQVNSNDLHTYDITSNYPANYCYQVSEVEKTRYTGNGENFQLEGSRGSGSPACSTTDLNASMQLVNDGPGGVFTQTMFLANDQNAAWFDGGGHQTWSPTIVGAPGGGYFAYNHVDGSEVISIASCNSTGGNIATCTMTSDNVPVYPSGTRLVISGVSLGGYNGTWSTTATVGQQSNQVSFQIASNPGAATGGTLKDGNQWEVHTIGINATSDVTNMENVDSLSGQTDHMYWPWGSTANGGTATDWFIVGFDYNGVSQYPTQVITGCTYSGSAPTGTAVCTLANNLPGNWIVPGSGSNTSGLGSLGASTVYTSGVTDGSTTCYNGWYPITASTSNTYSYQPRCTPAASSNANTGSAYVPATDELIKCYRNDATFGNQCLPLARTYTAQVTSDFFFQTLPNGSNDGSLVEFDSAPGTAPISSFGKIGDAQSALTGAPPYNATGFYFYAGISPVGTVSFPTAGPVTGVTYALQAGTGANQILTLTASGDISANGGRYLNGGCPQEIGTAEVEGCPMGSVTPFPEVEAVTYGAENNYFDVAVSIPTATVTATPALTWPTVSGVIVTSNSTGTYQSFMSGNTSTSVPTVTAVWPFQGAGAPTSSTFEGAVQQGIANNAVLSNLKCVTTTTGGASATPGGGGSWNFFLRQNGSSTVLTCNLGATVTSCADAVHTVAVAAGDQFDYLSYPSATPSNGQMAHCSVQVTY